MKEITINRPKVEDTELINEFFELAVKHTFERNGIGFLDESIKEEIQYKRKILIQDFESEGKSRYFLIAKEGEKIIGTVEYGPSTELINSCTKGALKEIVEVGSLLIHPEYQERGLGSRLFNLILLELDKKGIEEFCFDSGYRSAQRVWKYKFGNPQYHLKDYWGEDGDHMVWRLKVKEALK